MTAEHLRSCRQALGDLQTAVEAKRWQHMARCQQFYAAAFGALQQEWQSHSPSDADIEQLRYLERQQRRLKRLLNQQRQDIQEHLGMMQQAQKRLDRLRHALALSQTS